MKKYRTVLVRLIEIGSLRNILNEYAEKGWTVKTSTSTDNYIIVILEKEIN